MRRGFRILILFLITSSTYKAQLFFCLRNDTLQAYNYSGGDEFNGKTINENDWGLYLWPKTNMAQSFAYDPNNTTIEDGVAVFSLKQKDSVYTINPTEVDSNFIRKQKIALNNHKFNLRYTAGSIISKQKYHYGLYELRFKIEKGKGVWPAFWFFGGYKNEEIDVFELKGERANELHVDTHCPSGCDRGYKNRFGVNSNWGDWMPSSNYLYEGFNLMLLDWRPNELIWYINGYPLAYFKGSFTNPMHMFINTQVASAFSAFQPGPDETLISPNNFYVDYVRVWKSCSKSDLPILKQQGDLTISNRFVSDYLNKAERKKGLMYDKRKLNIEQGMISIIKVSESKLSVNLIGTINTPKTKFVLKGAFGQYTFAGYGREHEIIISPYEKELELILTLNNKTYSHKIILG